MATSAKEIYRMLQNDFEFVNASGVIKFNLKDYPINVEQNNVVGNILEEWLAKWMINENNLPVKYNKKQSSPDFWINPDESDTEWMEVKSFTNSPNFDIGNFRGYINEIIQKPYKLNSDYLLIKYRMEEGGTVVIEDFWLKKVWEISSPMGTWPIKVQYRNKMIVNMRPATWYSPDIEYPTFKSIEHFLAALEQTIYKYHDTNSLAEHWLPNLLESYKRFYNVELDVPRWNDIKDQYKSNKENQ